jgi:hypothetical protein
MIFSLISFFNKVSASPIDSLKKVKIGILPTAFYTPETRLGVGSLAYSYFKTNSNDTLLRKSNTQSYISYTLNKQFAFENDYQIWLKSNFIYLSGAADFSKFPEYFYGIGNDTKLSEQLMVSFNLIRLQTKNLVQIKNNLFGGITLNYQNLYNQDIKLMASDLTTKIHGNMGYNASGFGLIIMYDKRNNPLNPSKGSYMEASYTDYKSIKSNVNMFANFTLDARKYATLYKKLIWNANAYFSYNKGEVPYRMLAELGGARFLRGYYKGRFRDNNAFVVQQEFRLPVYKSFGIAAFGGIGSVANTISQFQTNEIHYNYGVGLRIRVNKKENTNIRLDYGFTKDSHGLYIVFAEAF